MPDFEQLLTQHQTRVLSLALRLTGNLADAQDIAQEVFMRLHRNLKGLPAVSAVAPWLHRVTVNACFDLGRKSRSSRLTSIDGLTLTSNGPDPEALALRQQHQDRIQSALLSLGERERAAIVLRDLEGLTTAEVAAALGTTEATIRVQISRARLKLRARLTEVRK